MEFRNTKQKEIVQSLSTENNKIWKGTSRTLRTKKHILAINKPNGMAYFNSRKAEAIAENLRRRQFTSNTPLYHPQFEEDVDMRINTFLYSTTANILMLVNNWNVQKNISGYDKKKTPVAGLIHFFYVFTIYTIFLVSRMITLNLFPDCGKKLLIIQMPKCGASNRHIPSNQRTIYLLSHASKIYQFMLLYLFLNLCLNNFIDSNEVNIVKNFGLGNVIHSTLVVKKV